MRILKIPGLIFIFAALFFGALQIFNDLTNRSDSLTLMSLWQRVLPGDAGAIRRLLPSGFAQDLLSAILSAPAWLAALCVGGTLWILGRSFGDDD
jgi:hypothetical protein